MTAPSERAVIDRFREILEGRGADGSVSPEATARAIPAKYFRVTDVDPQHLDGSHLDRAVFIPHEQRSDRVPRNVHSPHRNGRLRLVLRIGYAASALVSTNAWKAVHGESTDGAKQDAARRWQTRAQDDALRIARAFEWHELTGSDTNPVIENVIYQGTTANSVDATRGIATVEFEVWTESNET